MSVLLIRAILRYIFQYISNYFDRVPCLTFRYQLKMMSRPVSPSHAVDSSIKSSPPEYVYDDFDRIPTDEEGDLDDDHNLVIVEHEEEQHSNVRETMPTSLTEALTADKYGQPATARLPRRGSPYKIPERKPEVISPNRHDRMRLRPWLIRQIDSGEHPGLAWLNDEKTLFRIPWMHRSKREWTLEHSGVFVASFTFLLPVPKRSKQLACILWVNYYF